jgi:hypothetical protein
MKIKEELKQRRRNKNEKGKIEGEAQGARRLVLCLSRKDSLRGGAGRGRPSPEIGEETEAPGRRGP